MICHRCRNAADSQLSRDEHCDATGGPGSPCDCGHRTDRYRTPAAVREPTVVIHVHQDPPRIADEIRNLRRYGPGRG
ncbi:hypothetical protein AB0M87_04655 [Streptomyces sp. NPDC051320]|uniref:hypothetical protein n=1 Tax=Streptomyces sp. NPDC051320 TaxID=3154644 RepID=UPI003436273C